MLLFKRNPIMRSYYEEYIGEPFDEVSDVVKLVRMDVRSFTDHPRVYYLKTDTLLLRAFGEYFIRTYGEYEFIETMLCSYNARELTGKSLDEIVTDFLADVDILENDP